MRGRLRAASAFGGNAAVKWHMVQPSNAVEHCLLNRSRMREAFVTNPEYRDPSLEYPPTRPTWRILLAAVAVVAVAIVILNWSQLSAYAHVSQIENEIEQVVGL